LTAAPIFGSLLRLSSPYWAQLDQRDRLGELRPVPGAPHRRRAAEEDFGEQVVGRVREVHRAAFGVPDVEVSYVPPGKRSAIVTCGLIQAL
jgi:hypothetical protein